MSPGEVQTRAVFARIASGMFDPNPRLRMSPQRYADVLAHPAPAPRVETWEEFDAWQETTRTVAQ